MTLKLRLTNVSRGNRHPTNIRHLGHERTRGERLADVVAARVGSWPFIIGHSVLLMTWVLANGFLIHDWIRGNPFDPYPFILLNLLLSLKRPTPVQWS